MPDQPDSRPTSLPTLDSASAIPFVPRDWEDPEVIGPYRILEKLGEGGMGVVYMAEQTEPVKRRVALKLIKPGMDTKQVVARFEAERQALALMDHPNVARVFEAGTTERGLPYFVMEYVKGSPITEHCDRQRLSIEERINLFIDVCDAVQHAHFKGIIHRDLKPSNVLVAYSEGRASPKIIDFGVAKATDHHLTEKTLFTRHGMLVGTPEYMSPEQAEATGQDIDTRADIYSLGVLLYELLTGVLPFDSKSLRSAGLGEIHRVIREIDPPKPSTRLSSITQDNNETGDAVSKSRNTDLRSLSRRLRADLDWVVMKCLEKDRSRRYDSAAALAVDLRHFLDHEPVAAGPPSASYRAKKFVRRHRTGVATAGLVSLALVVGLAGATWQWSVASTERARAQQSEAEAFELAENLVGTFHERVAPLPGALTVREDFATLAIEQLQRAEARNPDDDRVLLALAEGYDRVGDVQAGRMLARRGDVDAALTSYETSRDYRARAQQSLGDEPDVMVGLARSNARLAYTRREQEKQAEALGLLRDGVAQLDSVPEPDRNAAWQETRGWIGLALASTLAQTGSTPAIAAERLEELNLSARLLRDAVVQRPTTDTRLLLARTLSGLAELQRDRSLEETDPAVKDRLREEGLARIGESIGQLRAVVDAVPGHSGARHSLAAALLWRGLLERLDGDNEKAVRTLESASEQFRFLSMAEPEDHQSRLELGRVHELRALAQRKAGDPAAAFVTAENGLSVADELITERPSHPEYRRLRVGLLEQASRAAAATGSVRDFFRHSQAFYAEADAWDEAHPEQTDWAPRKVQQAGGLTRAALESLLASPEGETFVKPAESFLEQVTATIERWRLREGFEERIAPLTAVRERVTGAVADAG